MAETLLSKHEKTVAQMKKLLTGIQGSLEGSMGDKKQEQFQYNQFADKWRKTNRDKEYGALLKSLGIKTNLRTALFRDPKKLYVELNKKRVELEKAMGTKYKRNLKGFRYGEGIFTGIKGTGLVRGLLGTGINPEYIRGYDQEVIALHDKEAERAKADFLRSTDRNMPGFDEDAWRLNLTADNPHRNITVRDKVYNIQGTQYAGTPGVDGPKMRPGTISSQAFVDTDPTGKAVDTPAAAPKESLKVGTTYGKDNRYPLTIAGKKTSSIQRDLIDAGFSVPELERLIANDKAWRAARRR